MFRVARLDISVSFLHSQPHTDIGTSESTGAMQTYCSPDAVSSPLQGTLATNFWSNVEFKSGTGNGGGRYAQRLFLPQCRVNFNVLNIFLVTGCINTGTLDRLDPNDGGGQYDSSGGDGGLGNPQGSICVGYVLRLVVVP
jgi:hypothetical protein